MANNEKKSRLFLIDHVNLLMFIVISIVAFLIRLSCFGFKSYDYIHFLNPWYQLIKQNGGLHALKSQVGNYGILYQSLIAVSTYFPIKNIIFYKTLSVVFDYLLALLAAVIARNILQTKSSTIFLITYSIILILPTVYMNSAMWGQCDSIYCFFTILALYGLLKKKYWLSFISLGVAFAFKLQTIFILPFFLLVYLINGEFSILFFLVSLCSFYVCNLPGILMGRSFLSPFTIYFHQTKETRLNLNIPNFSGIIGNVNDLNYIFLKHQLILLTVGILIIGYYILLSSNKNQLTNINLLNFACWTCWSCVMFLPSMHERYFYLVDFLLTIIVICNKKALPNFIIEIFVSLTAYLFALLNVNYNLSIASFIALLNYGMFSYSIFKDYSISTKQSEGRLD